MKTKKEIENWILKNCIDTNGIIYLSDLDFGDIVINLSGIRAKIIYNNFQESYEIHNAHQKAFNEIYNGYQEAYRICNEDQKSNNSIDNSCQEAKNKIYNGYQKAFKIINNSHQKAKEIDNSYQAKKEGK